jgi:energy-coupling factor transport system permease protein
MRAEFDLFIRRDTWLHKLDPRVKLLFVLEASLFLLLWPGLSMAAAMLGLCTALLWAARIPPSRIGQIWRTVGVLSLMVFLLTALFGGGESPILFQLGPLRITAGAVEQGAVLAVRLLALALIFACWLFTTDQASMVRGFVALRMPYEWGLTLALALRYLPIFAGLFEQVREAQQARGLDLDAGGFWKRLRAHEPVLVAMIVTALRNSEHLGWALEARAFGAHGVRRSEFRSLHLDRMDWLVAGTLALALFAAIALRAL